MTSSRLWTLEEEDLCLEALLPCKRSQQVAGVCDRLAKQLQRGGTVGGDVVRRHVLWGLAVRLTEYAGPSPLRTHRAATLPMTIAERTMLISALTSRSKEAKETRQGIPDEAYLAKLLMRPFDWVAEQMKLLDPARGIQGFFP